MQSVAGPTVGCDQQTPPRCWSARRIVCDSSETAAAAFHRRCPVHLQTYGWLCSQEFVDQMRHLFNTQVVVAYGMTEAGTRRSTSTECSEVQPQVENAVSVARMIS